MASDPPADSFEIRAATEADAAELAWLEGLAREALADVRGGAQLLAEQPPVGDWTTPIAHDGELVWVATIDGVVLGYLQLALPTPASPTGRVLQVFVHPEARELGFGDEMLAAAIDATRAAGGDTIESFALPGDRETKNLFERAAVTARKLIVSKRLG